MAEAMGVKIMHRADAMEKAADAEAKAAVEGKAEVAKLQAQYDAITAAEHAKLMGALTKEQVLKWERQELETAVVAALFPVQVGAGPDGMMAQRQSPTEAQKAIILKACTEAAATLQGSPNPYDAGKRKEATAKLIEQVREALAKANASPVAPGEQ